MRRSIVFTLILLAIATKLIATEDANTPSEPNQSTFVRSRRAGSGRNLRLPRPQRGRSGRQRDESLRGDSIPGLVPLCDMGADAEYKGRNGGLYGGGRNEPNETHQVVINAELKKIQPLDTDGKPAKDGKIVFVSIGMSNTYREFKTFKELADKDPQKSESVFIIQAAQPSMDVVKWSDENTINNFKYTPDGIERGKPVWSYIDKQLAEAGLAAKQVQVVWIKQARMMPQRDGAFPAHVKSYEEWLTRILQIAKKRYPNLRVAYLSTRIYAGYSKRGLSPEPYAYENAFGVRNLIQQQVKGSAELIYDANRGPAKAPLILWGPYLWANGKTPRKTDGLTYLPEDFDVDMTHPGMKTGAVKVAKLLLKFLKTDHNAKGWFLKQ